MVYAVDVVDNRIVAADAVYVSVKKQQHRQSLRLSLNQKPQ